MVRSAEPASGPCDGILLLDKPVGLGSNAALQRVKRLLGASRAGHTGSLDPFASGMLPICLGEATKVAGALLDARKGYRFTLALGARTASGDREQPVIETRPVPALSPERIREVVARFTGEIEQVPPMFSALKREGQPLYRLARRGVEVERRPRKVTVHRLEHDAAATGLPPHHLRFVVTCSKGTYIRSLAEDLAAALGTCGHVAELRREWVEPFEGEPLTTLEELEKLELPARRQRLLPVDRALREWRRVELDAERARWLLQGRKVQVGGRERGPMRAYGPDGRFLGIVEGDGAGALAPRRMMANP